MTMADHPKLDVVIFCAGRGTRLRPLTDTLPKVLVPILGVPLLDYHLASLSAVGVRRVICVTGYRSAQVHSHVNSGHTFGMTIEFVQQATLRGTGDALVTAMSHVISDPFGVVYGDVFFARAKEVWKQVLADPQPKMVCAEVEDAGSFGRVVTKRIGDHLNLEAVVEKDGMSAPGLVNAGLYLLPRDIVTTLAHQPLGTTGEVELPQAIIAHSKVTRKPVRVVKVNGWVDVGTLDGLRGAERLMVRD